MDKKNYWSDLRENIALPKMVRRVLVEEKELTRLAEGTILSFSEEKELMAIAEETEQTLLAVEKCLVEKV